MYVMITPKALRPYQRDAVLGMTEAHRTHRRILVSLPTGTGKTLIAGHYLKTNFFERGDTILWIAHTEELLDQAYATLTGELNIPEDEVLRHFARGGSDGGTGGSRPWGWWTRCYTTGSDRRRSIEEWAQPVR